MGYIQHNHGKEGAALNELNENRFGFIYYVKTKHKNEGENYSVNQYTEQKNPMLS